MQDTSKILQSCISSGFTVKFGFQSMLKQKENLVSAYLRGLWLVAPKKISPDFLKNPLVTRLFRTFFIFFLAPCNGLRSFLSNFIENRKRYHPNQVNFISPKLCSSVSKYPDSISWNGMCFFAKDEPSCPQYSSTSLRTSE